MSSNRLWASLSLAFLAGCLRSTGDLPQPGEGAFITGVVVQRDNVSGEVSGVAGARVSAVGISISATTDQRGFFILSRLPLGRLKIRIEKPALAGAPALARSLDPLNALIEGQTLDLGEIELLPGGALTGFVGTNIEGAAAPGIAGGALVIGAQTTFKAIAGEDGNYLLSGLPEGSIDLVAFLSGYEPGRIFGARVQSGLKSTVEDMVLEPDPGGASIPVAGVALLQEQTDSSGIAVKFIDETNPTASAAETNTAANGAFSVSLSYGVYRARFSKDGFQTVELPGIAVLKEGVVGLVPVLLGAQLEGDLDGDGIPDAQDPDRDNDGCPNDQDAFPNDPFGCKDTDGDGFADELDLDDDNDTLSDAEELSLGTDGFVTSPIDRDTDRDGLDDASDNCPTIANPGQEDICHNVQPGGPPELLSVTPSSGKAGDLVTLTGRNFMDGIPSFVQFGEGPLQEPESVAPTMILVEVPAGARTGTVTIYLPNGIARLANAFSFRPPPEVDDFQPRIGRKNSVVAVVGKYFVAEGLQVFVNGVQAEILEDTNGDPIIEDYFGGREPQKLIRIRVPDTTTGPIRVSTRDGFGQSEASLVIAGGPTILEVRPNPVLELDTVLINGVGFSTSDTAGEVTVLFPGVAAPQTPIFRTDTSIEVQVPLGARTGTIAVLHPAGSAESPEVLEIGGDAIYVSRIQPSLAKEGETIVLRGAGLSGATEVRFGAAAAMPLASSNATQIDVIVPAGAAAGPLQVVLPSGTVTSAVPFRKLIVGSPVGASVYGLGYSSNGDVIYAITFSDGLVLDSETLQQLDSTPLMRSNQAPNGFAVAPDGTWGIFSTQTTVFAVSLPDYLPLFQCADAPRESGDFPDARPAGAFRFDPASERAFVTDPISVGEDEDGVLVIDRFEGGCEVIARAPEPSASADFRGLLLLSDSELLLSDAALGVGIISIDRDLLYGQFVAPFQGPAVPETRLFWAPGNAYVIAAGSGLRRVDPTGSTPAVVLDVRNPMELAQSADRRWLSTAGRIYDVDAARFPRPGSDYVAGPVAWHPTRNEFVGPLSNQLVRVQIIEH